MCGCKYIEWKRQRKVLAERLEMDRRDKREDRREERIVPARSVPRLQTSAASQIVNDNLPCLLPPLYNTQVVHISQQSVWRHRAMLNLVLIGRHLRAQGQSGRRYKSMES